MSAHDVTTAATDRSAADEAEVAVLDLAILWAEVQRIVQRVYRADPTADYITVPVNLTRVHVAMSRLSEALVFEYIGQHVPTCPCLSCEHNRQAALALADEAAQ